MYVLLHACSSGAFCRPGQDYTRTLHEQEPLLSCSDIHCPRRSQSLQQLHARRAEAQGASVQTVFQEVVNSVSLLKSENKTPTSLLHQEYKTKLLMSMITRCLCGSTLDLGCIDFVFLSLVTAETDKKVSVPVTYRKIKHCFVNGRWTSPFFRESSCRKETVCFEIFWRN